VNLRYCLYELFNKIKEDKGGINISEGKGERKVE